MTFKMLIVDDEPIISRGLGLTIPWETINVEVVDTACDGDDAIQKVKQYGNIDIVITDVRMPKADGLQLASFLHSNFPQIRTIILSGYDEFEYAQQAIKLGVKDYLLKPVKVEELVEKVKILTNEIEKERYQQQELYEIGLKNAINQQISNLQGDIPTTLNRYNHIEICPFISMHQNYMNKVNDLSVAEIEEFLSGWKKTIENGLREHGLSSCSFFTKENILLTCVYGDDGQDGKPGKLRNTIQNEGYALQIVWFDKWIPLGNLKTVYTKLVNAAKFLPLTKDYSIVVSDQLNRTTKQLYPAELEKKVIDAVIQKEDTDLHLITNELFQHLSSNEFFLEEVVQVCREILNKIENHFKSIGGTKVNQWDLNYKENVDVHLYNSYELLEELFYQDISTIHKVQFELNNLDRQDLLIDHAKEYIHEYYRTNIKVNEVADVINITPNYFSSLFKQKTGVNFNEYVNQLRVDEAKVLLAETPFKISEISEQVGFHEYKHFVGVFKKLTGMTPTDYRKFRNLQDDKKRQER